MSPERNWQFHCPECGFGSVELSYLAADHEIHCELCLDEQGRVIVLHRWLTDATPADAEPADDLAAPPPLPAKPTGT